MKCPLLTDKNYGAQLERTLQSGDCIKADCAWWDIITERCAVLEVSVQLRSLNAILVKMGQNMTLR